MNRLGLLIFIPLILLMLGIFVHNQTSDNGQAPAPREVQAEASEYPEYDLIPEALKREMALLKSVRPNPNYFFCYYFDIEDVNNNYLIVDANVKILYTLPVTQPEVLASVKDKIRDNQGKIMFADVHPDLKINPSSKRSETQIKRIKENFNNPGWSWIQYIIPVNNLDFSKLKIAIIGQTLSAYPGASVGPEVFKPEEVDTLPAPIRGYAYFEKLMIAELKKFDVFTFYDLKGKVVVEFTAGAPSLSPNVLEGFSTSTDRYEAYQADGAFIKALNQCKVHWKTGVRKGKPVRVRIPLTFLVDGQNISLLNQTSN